MGSTASASTWPCGRSQWVKLMDELLLTGKTQAHLTPLPGGDGQLQPEAATAFERMREEARAQGIHLVSCSSFRSYDRQLQIWNEKARGERPVLDEHGNAIEMATLPKADRLHRILRWSAVPGASRHHWGTDLDVFDAKALPQGYRLRLSGDEYAPDGIFGPLVGWLQSNASRFGFFAPYRTDRGGVHPEPWHLSYAPVALLCEAHYDLDLFMRTVSAGALELQDELLSCLKEVYKKYLLSTDRPG